MFARMPVSGQSACRGRRLLPGILFCLILMLGGCTTEIARQTATIEAGAPTPTPIIPSGNLLTVNDEIVRRMLVPNPVQGAIYALTTEQLYFWRNREWVETGTPYSTSTLMVDPYVINRLFRGDHPGCGSTELTEPTPFEVSEDNGQTWEARSNVMNIRPLAIDPVFQNVVYGTNCSLIMSTDLGTTWRYLQALVNYEVIDLVVVGERLLVVGISTQGKSQVRELRLTTPQEPVISDVIIQTEGVASLDADIDRLVIGALDGVHISMDGGKNWTTSRIGLESVTIDPEDRSTPAPGIRRPNPRFGIRTILIDPFNPQRLFAGTVRGLYISQDNGGTWAIYRAVDEGIPVQDIQIMNEGADLLVTTEHGVVSVPNP